MTTNIVWITGATSGIGEALARTCPWPDTEIISVSRRDHPDLETVRFDLTDMDSWDAVGEHVTERLATFQRRARGVHPQRPLLLGRSCVHGRGRPGEQQGRDHRQHRRTARARRHVHPGRATGGRRRRRLSAWCRSPRRRRASRTRASRSTARRRRRWSSGCARCEPSATTAGKGPWVSAIRPGFVDTPAARRDAALPRGHLPRRRRHRRGRPRPATSSPPRSRPRTSGTRSPTRASPSRCCSSARRSASPPDGSRSAALDTTYRRAIRGVEDEHGRQ